MAVPSVFISSTFVDLQHVREHLEKFVKSRGLIPRLFEFGGVGFDFTQPLDLSCYEAVKESDIFVLIIGGRYGSASSKSINSKSKKYLSITRKEYLTASKIGKPVYTFIKSDVYSEYRTYKKNKGNKSVSYASVDNVQIFDFIENILSRRENNYVKPFSKLEDITEALSSQWAFLLKRAIANPSKGGSSPKVRINSFKLFYYRHLRNLSQNVLSRKVSIQSYDYRKLERFSHNQEFRGYFVNQFPSCDSSILRALEQALNAGGKLSAGQVDDFATELLVFYSKNRGTTAQKERAKASPLLSFETKAVVFDFDGTMVLPNNHRTTWEMIWEHLGYDVNQCAELHSQFRKNNISHEEWCQLTLEKFIEREFSIKHLEEIAMQVEKTPGLESLVQELRSRNIQLHILSGSIKQLIKLVLGQMSMEFEDIRANEMLFDNQSHGIVEIRGTKFDFEGKSDYLKDLVVEMRCSPMDILFVGNAGNDAWAHQSGVRTLCVNPTFTDPDNPKEWWQSIREMKEMSEILDYV